MSWKGSGRAHSGRCAARGATVEESGKGDGEANRIRTITASPETFEAQCVGLSSIETAKEASIADNVLMRIPV